MINEHVQDWDEFIICPKAGWGEKYWVWVVRCCIPGSRGTNLAEITGWLCNLAAANYFTGNVVITGL